jgi:lipopolysaccharide transport protein LptA
MKNRIDHTLFGVRLLGCAFRALARNAHARRSRVPGSTLKCKLQTGTAFTRQSTGGFLLVVLLFAGLAVHAENKDEAARTELKTKDSEPQQMETKIEADKASMDFRAGIATFEGNVVVVDKDVTVRSDTLIAHVTADNKLKSMEARGNVVITEDKSDRKATGGYAHYDVNTRKVVLKEKPKLIMADNVLDNAKVITYFLDSERILTEGTSEGGSRTTIILPGGSGDNGISIMDNKNE